MSTVKISQLPFITELNANTEKTLIAGVDLVSGLTGKISVRTLAEGLYSNDVLNVGSNPIILENVVAQFTDSSSEYIQINLQNFDGVGSSDYIASANNSDGSNNYIDMGINGPGFNDPDYSSMLPYDGYVYSHGPSHNDYRGNLVIGTASSNANVILIAGGTRSNNIVGRFNANKFNFFNQVDITNDLVVTGNVYVDNIIFGDSSIQETSLTNRLDAAFLKANNALANVANATFGFSLTSPQTITANILTAVHRLGFSANGLIRTETGTGNFKNLSLLTGDEVSTGNSGSINITTGSGGAVSGYGGDITITPGAGNSGYGKVNINVASNLWTFNTNGSLKFPDNTTQITASAPFSYSTASYGHANASFNKANAAFEYANASYGHANVAFDEANAAYALANNAYYLAAGALANTTGTFGGTLSITGNLNLNNSQSTITISGTQFNSMPTASPSVFMVTTNNAFGIQTNSGPNAKEFSFGKDGSLNLPGNLTVNGTVVLANSNFSPTEAALTITASGIPPATPSNDGYLLHLSGKQNVSSRIVADSYGENTYVVFAGRSARGTLTAPTAVGNNDVLMRVSGNGYGSTGFSPLGVGRVDIVASENHTDAARGTRIEMWNMPVGSNTLNRIAVFNGASVEFAGVVNPQKGFIFNPRLPVGNQTAITIDFATDVVIKANLAADLTVSFTNYTYGKTVELWLTNTGGTQRTITHGCSAINSTINSTTFTMPATSSAYLKYFSIDGDLANTFVTVQHA